MMCDKDKITLYHFKSKYISINIEAYFENNDLKIVGYDIGSRVEEVLGNSDYEYTLTIPSKNLDALYDALNITSGERSKLLNALAKKFTKNSCFEDIKKYLSKNNIKYDLFTWN